MSLALARAGAHVAVAGRRPEPLQETVAAIEALGRRGLAVPTDVTVPAQVTRLMQTVLDAFGQVDILINNAGIVRGQAPKPVWEVSDEEWRLGIDTNLSGAFYCVRAIARHMAERRRGKIINVASGFAYRGRRNEYMYTSAKAALVNLTRSLALSLARVQHPGELPGARLLYHPAA
ncbi:MAG: hypothetical protein KatS3mg131_2345 [Candidatus Tectimicrobiota bacterium]|nr:MAG: hypothetical protein KatS3mg131_2345 [Candidatus Tectomicrobia bacterium]